MQPTNPKSEFDSPWKSIISTFFEAFMTFFFPEAAAMIDWRQGYESLDTELEQLMRREGSSIKSMSLAVPFWQMIA
ncbi:MAG: hypothetical protein AAF633_00690 [Chloroflexota bacterium]